MEGTLRCVLVTGAAGFIGSNLVHHLRSAWPECAIVSFDALTYSGNLSNLTALRDDPLHTFVRADITDREAVRKVFEDHPIDGVMHLAAESHVDRSLVDPLAFVRTNIDGTATLLHEATRVWKGRSDVRFHHVSTDEVFGSLGAEGAFDETTPYDPRSPYSASKAASDHLVRAWHHSYGLPVVITNCSNNYGPYQFPEKLIPVVFCRATAGETIPVYGTGDNVRDWLHVHDHCTALAAVFSRGAVGQTYCVGGNSERSNLGLVHALLDEIDRQSGAEVGSSRSLIRFVTDRPGHDFRYAIDASRIRDELGWTPSISLEEGLAQTVGWYLGNRAWLDSVRSGEHTQFMESWYAKRT
jgi:dTDP-glucose 4,6-dehydratase